MADYYGEARAYSICNSLNQRAPLTVRVNTTKIKREDLMDKLTKIDRFPLKITSFSPFGLTFTERISVLI
jgi:16S rRNA C967 or C1407 C5-methylase (RsmB/RsmF family)